MFKDMITKYYDKRDDSKSRKYYDTTDELFKAKKRNGYVGRYIIPSWLGIKNIEVDVNEAR